MLSDIKKKYPYMLSMVILAVEKVNEAYDLDIAEDEAAYLVLHFQASIERMQQERTPVKRAVIVCDLGVGMSHLLQAKLAQSYKSIHILGCISKAALNEFVETHEIDLIISTTGINDCEIPKVEITPLLETDDKKRLNQVLQLMERELADRGEMFSTIKQLLNEDTIYFDIDLKHRFEVVEMLASNLVGKGFAETSFVHSAMLREQTSATAIGGGIAIPHAHPDLVKKSVVSIAVLHEPLEWGSEVVWVVFMLSIAKADQHMTKSLMQTIASISEKPAAVEHLKKANSVSDILTVFDQ